MSNEAQLDELLYRWEELAEQGEPITPEHLCDDCPELVGELTKRVKILKEMDDVFDTNGAREDQQAGSERLADSWEIDVEIPGYEIQSEIGRGGMGVVYKARQIALDRIVAIKTMRGGPTATKDDIDRFHTEAESAAKLSHPNIVAIHEVGEVNGRHFLSMDCIDGQNLDQMIRETSVSSDRAARYMLVIAEAIHAAHEQGILHRDLKPSNVIIDTNDQPHITDFGLAKRITGDSKNTATGEVLGTPSFMPPEQAIGDNDNVDRRSDVYALGGLLYAMLTGRPPFRADSSVATVIQVINDEPVPPRRFNAAIDRDLETICLKCLEKNPGARYETAKDVAAEFERVLNGHPILARPISSLSRTLRWCRRNPTIASLAAAVVMVLVLGTAVSTYFAIQSHQNATIAKRNAQSALNNLKEVKTQKEIADRNANDAIQAEAKTKLHAEQLQKQTTLLRQSIHSYLSMYLRTCAIAGDIAAAENADAAAAFFARFDSTEQLITNRNIAESKKKIGAMLSKWKQQGGAQPEALNHAALELAKQCRIAWEHRCNAIFSGRRGESPSVIRAIERKLIVQELYDRAIAVARGLAESTDVIEARGHRREFEKLYWGELHFVESDRLNSRRVESAMVRIREYLQAWQSGPPPPELASLVSDLENVCRENLSSATREKVQGASG